MAGRVESIHLASEAWGPVRAVESVRGFVGRGLEGDRYFLEVGDSPNDEPRGITLIEAEALEGLRDNGIGLGPGESRRNVMVRGADLNSLVGRRFRVGTLECVGAELCHPCRSLERHTEDGVLKGLAGRGGLRGGIVGDGVVSGGGGVGA